MNGDWVSWIAAGLTVVGNWGLLAFYFGRHVEKSKNFGTWLGDLEEAKNDHETRISRVEGRMGIEER